MKLKQRFLLLILAAFFFSCEKEEQDIVNSGIEDYQVAVYYVIPKGLEYRQENYNIILDVAKKAQSWFHLTTIGNTFEFEEETLSINIYQSLNDTTFYSMKWYDKLITDEMYLDDKLKVYKKGFVSLVFIEGIDYLKPNSLGAGQDWLEGETGIALIGLDKFVESTKIKTVIHELGHSFGLEHTREKEDLPLPESEEILRYSIMCQNSVVLSRKPEELGLVPTDIATLLNNKFFKPKTINHQYFNGFKIINHPTGDFIPVSNFEFQINDLSVTFDNSSIGGEKFYWLFDNNSFSTEAAPNHNFTNSGEHIVTLYSISSENQISSYTKTLTLN